MPCRETRFKIWPNLLAIFEEFAKKQRIAVDVIRYSSKIKSRNFVTKYVLASFIICEQKIAVKMAHVLRAINHQNFWEATVPLLPLIASFFLNFPFFVKKLSEWKDMRGRCAGARRILLQIEQELMKEKMAKRLKIRLTKCEIGWCYKGLSSKTIVSSGFFFLIPWM